MSDPTDRPAAQRIAIVATHGVLPHQRYGFQDEVASSLCEQLNTRWRKAPNDADAWASAVIFPAVQPPRPADPVAAQQSTVTRVYRAGDDPQQPALDAFDVYEAYWSPIDKGQASAASVLSWLLATIFLPFNDTARYMERPLKVCWDVGYILIAIVLGVAAFLATLGLTAVAYGDMFVQHSVPLDGTFPFLHVDVSEAIAILTDPRAALFSCCTAATGRLAVGFIGAYVLAQAVRASYSVFCVNLRALLRDRVQLVSRAIAIAILLLFAAAAFAYCLSIPTSGARYDTWALVLVAALLAFEGGKALMLWFLPAFFGDVQIYTTRDQNSAFYAFRRQILDVVTRTILHVIRPEACGVTYDRVHLMAHSLGSTIAMDAVIGLDTLRRERAITTSEWQRIRSFITFGTSLEKTKYFFNAWSPSLSQQYDEWQDDLYGSLFSADPAVLETSNQSGAGIFWLNCWYFTDFVADEILSYRSFALPGEDPQSGRIRRDGLRAQVRTAASEPAGYIGRLVAQNRGRTNAITPIHLVTHNDYLGDPWFWTDASGGTAALDVLTSGIDGGPPAQRRFVTPPAPYEPVAGVRTYWAQSRNVVWRAQR